MILEKHQSTFEGNLDEFCANEIVVLRQMIDLVELVHTLGEEQVSTFVASYRARLTESIAQLKQIQSNIQPEIAFTFVESELITAMRRGWWVLLENISSAPADVLERLNSFTEDETTLSLDEHFDDLVLSRVGRSINDNLRLFSTANLNRIHANKLSSAFLLFITE